MIDCIVIVVMCYTVIRVETYNGERREDAARVADNDHCNCDDSNGMGI